VRRIKKERPDRLHQQASNIQRTLRHIRQFHIFINCQTPQHAMCLVFGAAMPLHQQSLGAFYHFAFG
jgi:hypothetical protein